MYKLFFIENSYNCLINITIIIIYSLEIFTSALADGL